MGAYIITSDEKLDDIFAIQVYVVKTGCLSLSREEVTYLVQHFIYTDVRIKYVIETRGKHQNLFTLNV